MKPACTTHIWTVRPAAGLPSGSSSVPAYVAVGIMDTSTLCASLDPCGVAAELSLAIEEEQRRRLGVELNLERAVGTTHRFQGLWNHIEIRYGRPGVGREGGRRLVRPPVERQSSGGLLVADPGPVELDLDGPSRGDVDLALLAPVARVHGQTLLSPAHGRVGQAVGVGRQPGLPRRRSPTASSPRRRSSPPPPCF